jgi:transketolase N-terminal domain/subunit
MRGGRGAGPLVRGRAWLVTGPLGRGLAFAIDFAIAVRTGLAQRRSSRVRRP